MGDLGPPPPAPRTDASAGIGETRLSSDLHVLGAAIRNARDSILITDARGRDSVIVYANPAFEAHTGYRCEEILGRSPRFLQGPETSRETLDQVAAALTNERPVQVELINHRKDGTPFWVEMGIFPVFDERGRCAHFVSIQRDITPRKREQQELASYAAALEAAQAQLEQKQRALERHMRDLELAKEQAEAGNRAKTSFAANVSHELRTPLNGVLGMVALLRETRLDAEQQEYLELINSSGEALLAVISDVLDIAKVEVGRIELARAAFSVRRLVEDALSTVALRALDQGLELGHVLESGVPVEAIGDGPRIRQLLVNLLGNAVKFTERGSVTVRVAFEPLGSERGTMVFSVSDTGPGLPPAMVETVFDPFTRADDRVARTHGGTGLGLSIVRGLSRAMGGSAWVESSPGEGSTFSFGVRVEVPRSESVEGPAAGVRVAVDIGESILRETVVGQLSALGVEVVDGGASGPEADPDARVVDETAAGPEGVGARCIVLCSPGRVRGGGDAAHRLVKPPRSDALERALLQVMGREERKATTEAPLRDPPMRILVAEDNAVNERVITGMLHRLGHEAVVARDGAEALRLLEAEAFDLVLMDLQMPRMDGLEVTRRFRAGGGRVPVVALTANAEASERDRCLSLGMQDYLTKPVRMAHLARVIHGFSWHTATL